MNIPDVLVATDVKSPSHASVQPMVQREENVSTSTSVRMSCLVVCSIARTKLCEQWLPCLLVTV